VTPNGGVFRSIPDGGGRGSENSTNADVVFAATAQSVYKSTDSGASWLDVTGHLPISPNPSALFIDPANHSTIHLGSRCGSIGLKTGAERFRFYCQDIDLYLRARKAGWA